MKVLEAIGADGMGEVYKARDGRLNRTVAIKVLPSNVAEKLELKQRFEREAKTIAALNHPHVVRFTISVKRTETDARMKAVFPLNVRLILNWTEELRRAFASNR